MTQASRHITAENCPGCGEVFYPEQPGAGEQCRTCMYRAERRRPGRPATGKTPTRSMRLSTVYDQAKAKAEANGENITAVVERLLAGYVAGEDQPCTKPCTEPR